MLYQAVSRLCIIARNIENIVRGYRDYIENVLSFVLNKFDFD